MTSEFEQAILCGGLLANLETFPRSRMLKVPSCSAPPENKFVAFLYVGGGPSLGIFLLKVKMLF